MGRVASFLSRMAGVILEAAAVVAVMNLLFLLAILLTNSLVDHRRIFAQAAGSAERGEITARNYPTLPATQPDQWTDCIAIGLNLAGPPERSALDMFRETETVAQDNDSCGPLMRLLGGDRTVPSGPYFRYWHGYQVISKPLLARSGLHKLRYMTAALATIAIFAFAVTVFTAFVDGEGPLYGLWFAGSFVFLTDGANLAGSFTHALSLFSIFATPLAVLAALRRLGERFVFPLCVAAGSVLAFFDLLFNPPLGLMALMFAVLAFAGLTHAPRDCVRLLGLTALGWGMGFFGTYAARFILAALFAPDPIGVIADVFHYAIIEFNGPRPGVVAAPFAATLLNYRTIIGPNSFLLFAGATVLFKLVLMWRGNGTPRLAWWLPLLPAVVPVVWYEMLSSQSQVHYWFTYRAAAFSILCVATAILLVLPVPVRARTAAGAGPE